ncbi:hypothetical protein FB451DRAFT_1207445 [Mycena latifolia]|nr:hypothetical protein FB451DRAFT_1207445 [Mycena latifolia]
MHSHSIYTPSFCHLSDMPPPTNPQKNKGERTSILQKAAIAAGALRDVSSSSHVPFLQAISGVSFAIFSLVQSFKAQKQEYLQLVEQIHDLLWVVIDLSVSSEATLLLPSSVLHTVGNFAQTLQKIHSFLEGQLAMGTLKRLLRTGNTQNLEECKAGLRAALEGFALYSSMAATAGLAKAQIDEDAQHKELLALVAALSTSTVSFSDVSSIAGGRSVFTDSSNSLLSFLPPTPKIFHGRDGELQEIVAMLLQESPRVAILGSGGIGKTSLATAVIHHSLIADKFEQRYFVACEAAVTHIDLVHAVASHVQTEPVQNLVVRSLATGPPTLLVLDNLETAWEPISSRARVEELLSLLTDIPHLALLITMRGVERPAKVRWTRPFLAPLRPLSYEAARQTFLDISDEPESNSDIDELLRLTDHLPLAVSLIANLVSFDGSNTVLNRWKEEHTQLLSEGYDKRSNLDMSIIMSLSSPRMAAFPGAQDLLSVISMLPDGIFEADLMQCALPIQDIENCKVTLIRTSLAYVDRDGRIKTLVPVREYVQTAHPPTRKLVRPLRDHLYQLLMLWKTFRQVSAPECVSRISANLGNLQNVLLWELGSDDEDGSSTIRRILTLDSFMRATARGIPPLREYIPALLERCSDHQVRGEYISALFDSQHHYESNEMANDLETKAIREFQLANDGVGEVQLYNVLTSYHLFHKDDRDTAEIYCNRALTLATEIGDFVGQGKALMHCSELQMDQGNFRQGVKYAQQAHQAFGQAGHLLAQAYAIKAEVDCAYRLCDFKRSAQLCAQARDLLTLCGMQNGELAVRLMSSETEFLYLKTDYAKARIIQTQIVGKTSKETAPLEYAYALMYLAMIDFEMGMDDAAIHQCLDIARPLFMELKAPGTIFWCDALAANLQLRQGLKVEAKAYYQRSLEKYRRRRPDPPLAIACLSKLGDLEYGLNDEMTTFGYAVDLLAYGNKLSDRVATNHALRCIGDIFAAQGDDETALNLFMVARDGFSSMDVHRHKGVCLVRIADILERRGSPERARDVLQEARMMFETSSQAGQVAIIDSRLYSPTN